MVIHYHLSGFAITATSRPRSPTSWLPSQGRPTTPATSRWAPRPARPAAARAARRSTPTATRSWSCGPAVPWPDQRSRSPKRWTVWATAKMTGPRRRPGDPAVPDRPRRPGQRSVVVHSGKDVVAPGGGLLAQRPHQPARPPHPPAGQPARRTLISATPTDSSARPQPQASTTTGRLTAQPSRHPPPGTRHVDGWRDSLSWLA
jgi:hypothetical protein